MAITKAKLPVPIYACGKRVRFEDHRYLFTTACVNGPQRIVKNTFLVPNERFASKIVITMIQLHLTGFCLVRYNRA
jgi:hypothetical protein